MSGDKVAEPAVPVAQFVGHAETGDYFDAALSDGGVRVEKGGASVAGFRVAVTSFWRYKANFAFDAAEYLIGMFSVNMAENGRCFFSCYLLTK